MPHGSDRLLICMALIPNNLALLSCFLDLGPLRQTYYRKFERSHANVDEVLANERIHYHEVQLGSNRSRSPFASSHVVLALRNLIELDGVVQDVVIIRGFH